MLDASRGCPILFARKLGHGLIERCCFTSPSVPHPSLREQWGTRAYDLIEDYGGAVTAHGFPEGYYRYDLVSDDAQAGAEGHICTFTTGCAGELNLHLYTSWMDVPHLFMVNMETRTTFIVAGG